MDKMLMNASRRFGLGVFVFPCLLVTCSLFVWNCSLLRPSPVVLDLRGTEFQALYKHALRNGDGSLDLTVNIPASADVLQRLQIEYVQVSYNLTVSPRSNVTETKFAHRTYYPVTLETPFMINSPTVCEDSSPLHVLVICHSATANFQRRRLIRQTWAGKHVVTTRNLRLLFVLGQTQNKTTQRLIENEHLEYGDLIQGKFKDAYHNLTHKAVLGLRWIQQFCPQAQFILKIDDDVFINPFLFHEIYFPRFSQARRTIACHARPPGTSPVMRGRSAKWLVPEFEFRGYKAFPFTHCNGFVVIYTPDIIRALYKAAFITPFFWLDDVYVTGLLASKVGKVEHVNIIQNMTTHAPSALSCYKKPKCALVAASIHEEATYKEIWQLSLAQISPVIRSQVNPIYFNTSNSTPCPGCPAGSHNIKPQKINATTLV